MFAKIYEYESRSQILVKKDCNDDGNPEVRLWFEPDGLGVCSFAFTFNDSDSGFDSMDSQFDDITKDKAEEIVSNIELKIKL